jgi:hypothetical protein
VKKLETYYTALDELGVDVDIFRGCFDLEHDLDQAPGKVLNKHELGKTRLQDGL